MTSQKSLHIEAILHTPIHILINPPSQDVKVTNELLTQFQLLVVNEISPWKPFILNSTDKYVHVPTN